MATYDKALDPATHWTRDSSTATRPRVSCPAPRPLEPGETFDVMDLLMRGQITYIQKSGRKTRTDTSSPETKRPKTPSGMRTLLDHIGRSPPQVSSVAQSTADSSPVSTHSETGASEKSLPVESPPSPRKPSRGHARTLTALLPASIFEDPPQTFSTPVASSQRDSPREKTQRSASAASTEQP